MCLISWVLKPGMPFSSTKPVSYTHLDVYKGQTLTLAVMPLDADTTSLMVGETALTPRPLLGGLQR